MIFFISKIPTIIENIFFLTRQFDLENFFKHQKLLTIF